MGFLDLMFLENRVRTWVIAGAVALGIYLALTVVLAVVRNRLSKLAAHTKTQWDDIVVGALGRTRSLFLLILAIAAGSSFLDLPSRVRAAIEAITVLALVFQGGIWVSAAFTTWLSAYTRREMENDRRAATTLSALGFVVKLVLWAIIVLLALDNLGVNISALVAGLGIGGVAVALATQNILGDLFASLSILVDKPFVLGDFIIVDDKLGSVEKIGLKTTRVRSLWGEQVVFSNNDLLKSRLRNMGRMLERRVQFSLGVVYQTPRAKLQRIPAILREAIEAQEKIRFDRAHLKEYGDFAIVFEVVFFVLSPDYNKYMDIQQAIYLKIHETFETEGIEFAYPTQTLFLSRIRETGEAP